MQINSNKTSQCVKLILEEKDKNWEFIITDKIYKKMIQPTLF